jgi:hypothetical protein
MSLIMNVRFFALPAKFRLGWKIFSTDKRSSLFAESGINEEKSF